MNGGFQKYVLEKSVMMEDLMSNATFAYDERETTTAAQLCHYSKHQYLLVKFIFMSVIGTLVAVFGICGNITIALVLMQPAMRTANNLYLTVLAIFDTLVLLPGLMLYSMEYVNEYFDLDDLYVIWIQFVPYCYSLSHFAQTGSVYITVSVTFERYLAVLYPRIAEVQCTRHRTVTTIIGVFCFAAIFNCTKIFEIQVARNQNCTGFASRELIASDLLRNHLYSTVYSLWLTQFVMVFLPFGVLLISNTAISWSFKKSLRRMECNGVQMARNQLKEQSKDATRVLVTIVLVFLICNCWGFVTTLLEGIYGNRVLIEWAPEFYTFSREAINFLAIVNSSINFVICWTFGEDFRMELMKVCGCWRVRRRKAFSDRSGRVGVGGSPVLYRHRSATAKQHSSDGGGGGSAPTIPGLRIVDRRVTSTTLGDESTTGITNMSVGDFDEDYLHMIPRASYAALIDAARCAVRNQVDTLRMNQHQHENGKAALSWYPADDDDISTPSSIGRRRATNDYDFDYLPLYTNYLPSASLRLDLETTI